MSNRQKLIDWLISPVLPIVVVLISATVVRPWSDLPINDDWQYAHIARTLAEQGVFRIDRPIAPALLVQTLWGALLIKLFGFSHTLLRVATFVLSLAQLGVLDLIGRRVGLEPFRRAALLLLVGLNPIGFVTSLSFMTELYGTLPALGAIYVWLGAAEGRPPTVLRSTAATMLAATAYLTRQFSGLVLPALLLVSVIELLQRDRKARSWRDLESIVVSSVLFVAIIATHWIWNKGSGNETDQLANPLKNVLVQKGAAWTMMGGVSVLYLAGFLAPLLVLLWPKLSRRLLMATVLMALGIATLSFAVGKFHERHRELHYTLNKTMPYLTNVIVEGGIGPFSTTDTYVEKSNLKPRYPATVWKAVQYALFALAALWPLALVAVWHTVAADPKRRRLALIGAVFCAITLGSSLQVYGYDLFDRYLWTPFVGLALCLVAGLPTEMRLRGLRVVLFVVFLAPLATLSIGGTHDYFQWQKVRWHLYRTILHNNVSPLSIDSGYEPNGWHAYDAWKRGDDSPSCISVCHRNWLTWFTADDSYRIAHSARPRDIVIDRVQPHMWLSRAPALLISRKPDP